MGQAFTLRFCTSQNKSGKIAGRDDRVQEALRREQGAVKNKSSKIVSKKRSAKSKSGQIVKMAGVGSDMTVIDSYGERRNGILKAQFMDVMGGRYLVIRLFPRDIDGDPDEIDQLLDLQHPSGGGQSRPKRSKAS